MVETRHRAQAMVLAGEVLVDEQKVDKPGKSIAADALIRLIQQRPPFVSRAGLKLNEAIQYFSIQVKGSSCLDIGASTGGFTDCLLQHGATRVHAVDVGVGQLHWEIRQDKRVNVLEKLNARYLALEDIGEKVDFVSCDVSFISVTQILPRLPLVLNADAEAVILAKPQFEVGKGQVGKGGIVRDISLHNQIVEKVSQVMTTCGFDRVDSIESPILGAQGNREFLLYGRQWSQPVGQTAL